MYGDTVAPECEAAREAMSALIDGEQSPLSGAWLTAHLVDCGRCRDWYAAAAEIRRRSRLALVPEVPDLVDRVLAVTDVSQEHVSRLDDGRRGWRITRTLLACTAIAQLWFALPVLLFARDPDVAVHPAHELGSFDTALAIGFLVVVWRPRLARGMRPLVGVIAGLLVITAAIDLARGRTTLADEAPHLLAAVAFVLMCLMRSSPGGRGVDSVVGRAVPPLPSRPTDAGGSTSGDIDAADRGGLVDTGSARTTSRATA